ncbi:hypothetical protein McPS_03950 [Marichromatium sp. PS1]|uniref:hypothetical protein n=1 Tax=Marichromatium sp. PS1 TaxID=3138932 RepID=UPI0032E589C1
MTESPHEMNIEKLEKAARSHHMATEAIVDRIINNDKYKPKSFPVIVKKGNEPICIIDASSKQTPNADFIEAYITMASFSLELKIKLILAIEKGKFERGHKLMPLYESLSSESKTHIQEKTREITKPSEWHKSIAKAINEKFKIQFAWEPRKLISNSSEAFEKWRYHFEENNKTTWFAGYSELQEAINSRIEQLKRVESN